MSSLVYFIIAIVVIFVIAKLFAWPFKILIKLIINGVVGAILLYLVNFVGAGFGLAIPITAVTALVAGILGVPGVLFLIIFYYMR